MSNFRFLSLADADTFAVPTPDGAMLPVYALGGPAGAPGLLFGHANGLAAGSYEPWLRELSRYGRVFAFDARGHGGAHWPEGRLDRVFHVDRFADDLALVATAVAKRLDGSPLHYAGHSLNAAAALLLATRALPLPWASTTLFEPPIFPPRTLPHYAEAAEKQMSLIRRSAARRAFWSSPEALREVLQARSTFQRFRPDLLAAHCRATLRPLAEGGYVLCCPPDVEAAIFASHRAADTWRHLAKVRVPIWLVASDPTLPDRGWVAACMNDMAALLPRSRLKVLPRTNHMLVFEAPEACRDLIVEALGETPAR